MISKNVLAALLMALSVSVEALDVPRSSQYDSRIQYVDYNDGDIVAVHAYPGLGTQIVFATNEQILDIASGFTQGWEFSNRRNILYLKPKSIQVAQNNERTLLTPRAGKWDTNLLVTTNIRLYAFDLRLIPARRDGQMTRNKRVSYRVQFRYPADEAAKVKQAADQQAMQTRLGVKAPLVNWQYSMQIGDYSDSIAPTMAYDDGRFTYLKFPHNRDFPAVFLRGDDREESLVNTHIESSMPGGVKDVLVVHRVAPKMILRHGRKVVGLYNDRFDPNGLAPQNGTTVPGVKRVLRRRK